MSRRSARTTRRALADDARIAALDSAAAALAAIQMAKQARVDVLPHRAAVGSAGLPPANLRLPMGDVIYGAVQLQVDFARRLFEFNKTTSALLRDKLRDHVAEVPEPHSMIGTGNEGADVQLEFFVKNATSLSKRFEFRALGDYRDKVKFSPPAITLRAEGDGKIGARFERLPPGKNAGHIAVESQGIRLELVRFEVTVTKKAQ